MGTSAYCVVPMWIENQGHIGEFLLKFAYVVFLYLEERRDSMLLLEVANYEDREKEYEFVRDMPYDENGLINEWHGISKEDFDERALKTDNAKKLIDLAKEKCWTIKIRKKNYTGTKHIYEELKVE